MAPDPWIHRILFRSFDYFAVKLTVKTRHV